MKKEDFYYDLPKERIAQTPIEPRDASKMMVIHRKEEYNEDKHFYDIIDYIMKIAIGVALVGIAIGGVLYTISAGDSGAAEKAKTTIKNALIGFIIVFSAWLIVNTTISAIGARKDLGINVTGWGEFDCNASKGTEAGAKSDAIKNAEKFDNTGL